MIYIINNSIEHDLIKQILQYLNIEYCYLNYDLYEVEQLINSKEYKGIFLPFSYDTYFQNNFKKMYNKAYNCVDYISNENNKLLIKNSIYEGFKNFVLNENLNLESKTVLILGSSKQAISVYNAIKDVSNPVVYISTITDELDTKLRVGDRKIRKIEIKNLLKSNYIINTTELGNLKAINTSMLENQNIIPSNYAIDLLCMPLKTSFLKKYEIQNSIIYNGLYLLIYRVLSVIGDFSFSEVKNIYNGILEKGVEINEL